MPLFFQYIVAVLSFLHHDCRDTCQEEKIYTVSEVTTKPEPVDGLDNFLKKWSRRVTYPKNALERKIQGMVFIEFVVSRDGSIEDASVRSGIDYECDQAALEAFEKISQNSWKPGVKDGKPVRVKMVLPFYFKIIKT